VDYYNAVLEQAREHAEREHPEASAQHRAAFANSVAYLVTGWSGGYGGPSVREHAVSHAAAGIKPAGEWGMDEACRFAEPLVFGELTALHRQVAAVEHCFDDDPADVAALAISPN
jgi:hypothetical protein